MGSSDPPTHSFSKVIINLHIWLEINVLVKHMLLYLIGFAQTYLQRAVASPAQPTPQASQLELEELISASAPTGEYPLSKGFLLFPGKACNLVNSQQSTQELVQERAKHSTLVNSVYQNQPHPYPVAFHSYSPANH